MSDLFGLVVVEKLRTSVDKAPRLTAAQFEELYFGRIIHWNAAGPTESLSKIIPVAAASS
jgi:hypothetical protein